MPTCCTADTLRRSNAPAWVRMHESCFGIACGIVWTARSADPYLPRIFLACYLVLLKTLSEAMPLLPSFPLFCRSGAYGFRHEELSISHKVVCGDLPGSCPQFASITNTIFHASSQSMEMGSLCSPRARSPGWMTDADADADVDADE